MNLQQSIKLSGRRYITAVAIKGVTHIARKMDEGNIKEQDKLQENVLVLEQRKQKSPRFCYSIFLFFSSLCASFVLCQW
ncbi:MAG: hypothetical protein HYX60_05565 [Legionella longbeachae]|nr:hypothetical protein [Legionella longbeachae]